MWPSETQSPMAETPSRNKTSAVPISVRNGTRFFIGKQGRLRVSRLTAMCHSGTSIKDVVSPGLQELQHAPQILSSGCNALLIKKESELPHDSDPQQASLLNSSIERGYFSAHHSGPNGRVAVFLGCLFFESRANLEGQIAGTG